MAFTVRDFKDLLRILEEHPEWRNELSKVLLPEDFVRVPRLVRRMAVGMRGLVKAQRGTEERLGRLEAVVAELAEAQRRTEERLGRLEAVVAELAEAQRRTEARVEELAEAQRRTEARVEELAEAQRRNEEEIARLINAVASMERRLDAMGDELRWVRTSVDDLRGFRRESEFREKAHAYLGRVMVDCRVLSRNELSRLVGGAVRQGIISLDDQAEILWADAVLRGELLGTGEEVYAVVEVSTLVEPDDVERARDRARRLQRVVGGRVVPAVAGERVSAAAEELARQEEALVITNGRVRWPGR